MGLYKPVLSQEEAGIKTSFAFFGNTAGFLVAALLFAALLSSGCVSEKEPVTLARMQDCSYTKDCMNVIDCCGYANPSFAINKYYSQNYGELLCDKNRACIDYFSEEYAKMGKWPDINRRTKTIPF